MNNNIFLFICLSIISSFFLFLGGIIFEDHSLYSMIIYFIITGIICVSSLTGLFYNIYINRNENIEFENVL